MGVWILILVLVMATAALACVLAELRKGHQALQAKYQEAMRILSFKRILPSRRDVSQRECYDRLNQLGFNSLEEYQRSELWLRTKELYRRSDYPQRCLVCGGRDYDLHHRSYARLGTEELFDLVPLCREHHQCLHEMLDRDRTLCVKDTHDFLVMLMHKERPDQLEDRPHGDGTCLETKQHGSRSGKPWTPEEDAELLQCLEQRMTMEQMANRLHRGVKAIEVKLVKLGRFSVNDGGGGFGLRK